MPLRLTFLTLPRVVRMEFYLLKVEERCWNICPSVHPTEVPLVPINLLNAWGSVSSDQPTQHLTGSLVGWKKLMRERGNVCTNLYSSLTYSGFSVPLTDRGNMAERIYVSACQDGELLEFEPTEWCAFTMCTVCQKCGRWMFWKIGF